MGVSRKIELIPAVFLDRDGVINKAVVREGKPYPPASLRELVLIEGILDLVKGVKQLGYKVFVFTNQPDVARGDMSMDTVTEIHDYLMRELEIDKIYCCFHDNADNCDCRKPKPGMLVKAQKEWSVDFERSFVIGDRWRDIAAAKAVNIKSILIDYGYDEKKITPDFSCSSLGEAYDIIKNQ
jgi:D-glycero-D-manno-heptose 1,7-bisphosphate phosphatase